MQIVERGHGEPVLLIPGIQGRWEYFEPTLDALSGTCRAITFSLAGERGSNCRFDPAEGLDPLCDQVDRVMDRLGLDRAVLCGISFGGLIALRSAARRPDRTSALVLVSTPGPGFRMRRRHQIYTRVPWLFGPIFLAGMPSRVGHEIIAAFDGPSARWRFTWRQIRTFASAPLSVSRMAARARLLNNDASGEERTGDARRVVVPTLVVTGLAGLDYVVPPEGTSEYARVISGACLTSLDRSGHLGCITRPREFAAAVSAFVAALPHHRTGA
jgi:pimeloyl-ACP methyl ester carboxylesterase